MGIQIARAAVLLLAAALRLWRLNQNGYDNEYYAAAVRSMASGWHAFPGRRWRHHRLGAKRGAELIPARTDR